MNLSQKLRSLTESAVIDERRRLISKQEAALLSLEKEITENALIEAHKGLSRLRFDFVSNIDIETIKDHLETLELNFQLSITEGSEDEDTGSFEHYWENEVPRFLGQRSEEEIKNEDSYILDYNLCTLTVKW